MSPLSSIGVIDMLHYISFYVCARDLNSDSHACSAKHFTNSTLSPGPCAMDFEVSLNIYKMGGIFTG